MSLCSISTVCDWCQAILAFSPEFFHPETIELAMTISLVSVWICCHDRWYRFYSMTLSASTHNYLRISRILKCLSELGLEHLNAGFLLHVLNEQSEKNELNNRGLQNSMDKWWANCLRNSEERRWIAETIRKVRTEGFVFTREMYEQALQNRKRTGSLGPWN
jgi:hypothetical protein